MESKPQCRVRSLKSVVGTSTYRAWTEMLADLVPHGRTHRLGVVIAGMFHHAANRAIKRDGLDPSEGSVSYSLLVAQESPDIEEVADEIGDLLQQLFKDAGVESERMSAQGDPYSIVDAAAAEYVKWYEMPWE